MPKPPLNRFGNDSGNRPFIGTSGFGLVRLKDDPPGITDPTQLASDAQLCKIAKPDRAKCKKSDHKSVAH
jgi:hypothetical protein